MDINEEDWVAVKTGQAETLARLDAMAAQVEKLVTAPKPEVKPEVKQEVKVDPKPTQGTDDDDLTEEDVMSLKDKLGITDLMNKLGGLDALAKTVEEDRTQREQAKVDATLTELKTKYPRCNPEEVSALFGRDKTKTLEDLAKASHERVEGVLTESKLTWENELRAKIAEEQKGGKSIPQSSGAAPVPGQQKNEPFRRQEDEWGAAIAEARKSLSQGQ